ncbi:hypothetical protein OCU04_009150 [Sclerotinia nivalis]|uniref:Uncharacterized protein n=1 Tax=Sclerotinia nivalis TaxID=352851 RepID=A0A9X0DI88_9HELO|nr:hypothetical protein OCU04_009150 [Sclerotinia nivalis]
MALSSDGSILVTGSVNKHIMIWCSTMEEPRQWHLQQTLVDGIKEVSSDGSVIMALSDVIIIWRRTKNQPPRWTSRIMLPAQGNFESGSPVVLSPDGSSIAAGFENGDIIIWDIASEEYHSRSNKTYKRLGLDLPVKLLAYSSNSSLLASNQNDRSVRVWGPSYITNEIQNYYCYSLDAGEHFYPTAISFSPNSELLVLGFSDGIIRIIDITPQIPFCNRH